jgi:hypothetical protein
MTLYSTVRDDLADWIRGAITFEVQPGDYYGTGRLPAADQGQFLPDYSFCDLSQAAGLSHGHENVVQCAPKNPWKRIPKKI